MRVRTVTVLLVAALACAGCGAFGQGPEEAPAPSPAQIDWTGRMCDAVDGVRADQVASAGRLELALRPVAGFGESASLEALGLVESNTAVVAARADELTALGPSGVEAADAWVADLARTLGEARTTLEGLGLPPLGPEALAGDGASTAIDRARRSDALVQALPFPSPDLATLLAEEPVLGAAFARTPLCPEDEGGAPALDGVAAGQPLPTAADGANFAACAARLCEVTVPRQAAFVVGTLRLTASVSNGRAAVAVLADDATTPPSVSTATFDARWGAEQTVGPPGQELRVIQVAASGEEAVLRIAPA